MIVGAALVIVLVLLVLLTWLGARAVSATGQVAPFVLISVTFLVLGFWFSPFWIFMIAGPILWALLSPPADKKPRWDEAVARRRATPPPSPELQERALAEALESLAQGRCWACGAKLRSDESDRCHACGTFIGVGARLGEATGPKEGVDAPRRFGAPGQGDRSDDASEVPRPPEDAAGGDEDQG